MNTTPPKLSTREQFLKALIDGLHDKIMMIQDEVKKLKPKQIIAKLTELEQRIIKLEKDQVVIPKPKPKPKSKPKSGPKAEVKAEIKAAGTKR